eukprot:Tbor_TRINITY_DN187_c0_g1::TRINITY_DN187_c0_g1_i1::g.11999::m.11999
MTEQVHQLQSPPSMPLPGQQSQQVPYHAHPRPQISNGSGGFPNPEPEVLRNLIVNYIPTTIDETQLRQLFEMYGPIENVRIIVNRENRQSRGFGFVKYQYAMSAMQAIQCLNGYPLINKRLKVAYAKEQEAQVANQQMSTNPMYAQQMMMMYQHQHSMMQPGGGRGGMGGGRGRGGGTTLAQMQ